MASAAQTLSSNGFQFEVDTTQRTATMRRNGGYITNVGTGLIGVNFEGADVGTVTHAAAIAGGVGTKILDPGTTLRIPAQCQSFTFKGTGAGQILAYDALN